MVAIIGTFVGGLGFFLLAVSMISDGLRLAAGDALREILSRYTSTRLRGVFSGILVTATVQSSSAVTIATIGFVNGGLLTLGQALGVIYGANIGTTMTGWIVAIVGFSFKVEALALPMIGVGMLARIFRPSTRAARLGEALAGFGLFFIGVDFLRDAFEGFAADVDVAGFAPEGSLGILLYVGLGFFMTLVTQSSSAAIAITLTAATGGVLGLAAAAAMVIGANVGTTSTAALAVIGATANARRVAAAHLVFNLLTGAVALVLLAPMLWLVQVTGSAAGVQGMPAVSLALFHTVFNVLGLVLMWPLTTRLVLILDRRFRTRADVLATPQYLDRNVVATPALAIDALRLELMRALEIVCDEVVGTVGTGHDRSRVAVERREGAAGLLDRIDTFVTQLEAERLPDAIKGQLLSTLRVTGYFDDILRLSQEISDLRREVGAVSQPAVRGHIEAYRRGVLDHVNSCKASFGGADTDALDDAYEQLRGQWHELKSVLLEAAAHRSVPVERLNFALEGLRAYLKIAEQLTKSVKRLQGLGKPDNLA